MKLCMLNFFLFDYIQIKITQIFATEIIAQQQAAPAPILFTDGSRVSIHNYKN